jgi:hypothetical protein
MKAVRLDDLQLQAHLLSGPVLRTLRWFGRQVCDDAPPGWDEQTFWILRHQVEDPAGQTSEQLMEQLVTNCPVNLAERLAEALAAYRAVGRLALPPLIPLAHRLLQAELHLYTTLKSGKPYRDHLAHQTRVAALAHLWLTEGAGPTPALPLPAALCWRTIRQRWARTREFHFLRCHALRLGLPYPDPAHDDDPWGPAVASAALLAGLVHDVGYVQKALGQVSEPVAQTFDDLIFPPQVQLGTGIEQLPLAELYHAAVSEIEHGQRHATLASFLERYYRELHSVVGALWLATLPDRIYRSSSRVQGPDRHDEIPDHSGWTDLVLQLAAMMAFGHDLALSDAPRRAVLGLKESGKDRDVLNLKDFPLCTLFAFCDMVQEFGRPVRVIDQDTARFVVPLAGVELELVPAKGRTVKQGRNLPEPKQRQLDAASLMLDLPSLRPDEGERLYLSFCSRDRNRLLLTDKALEFRSLGTWNETRVGNKVPDWLKRAGLSDHIRLDGDPAALTHLKQRFEDLLKFWQDPPKKSERQQVATLLKAVLRVLDQPDDTVRSNNLDRLRLVLGSSDPGEQILLKLAPLAEVAETEPLPRLGRRGLFR